MLDFVLGENAVSDEPLAVEAEGIVVLEGLQFVGVQILAVVVGTRMAAHARHGRPHEPRPFAGAEVGQREFGGGMHGVDVRPVDLEPLVRVEESERERILVAVMHTDGDAVILDPEQDGEVLL